MRAISDGICPICGSFTGSPESMTFKESCCPDCAENKADEAEQAIKEYMKELLDKRTDEERCCHICGCTWNNACPGGCYWVEENLCSACVGKEEQK